MKNTWNKYRLHSGELIRIMKYAIGGTIAILLAYALHLNHPIAAGIIVILSIQNTKKATMNIAWKRIIAYAVACLVAYLVFFALSYRILAFGLFLLFFSTFCIVFEYQDALVMNVVLISHFYLSQSMSWELFINESLLLVIGAGIGILLNLYIPSNVKLIRKAQKQIEDCLKEVLVELAHVISEEEYERGVISCMNHLETEISEGMEESYINMNNTLLTENRYFVEYMEMRNSQFYVLREIYEKALSITVVTEQSQDIADFLLDIAKSLSEWNNTRELLIREKVLLEQFRENTLPKTREEFETRATLFVLLVNIEMFLNMKKEFVDSLSMQQKEKYWESK